jgi:tetraacyldisaccharide 4'-kinase
MKSVVWAGSALWSSASWLARKAAERGYLPSARLPARVISIGNLQAGGAGKTPLVARIAREACERGLRVCILTRGYQSDWESAGGLIAPGPNPANPVQSGDEPALLHELVPQAWIAVGADRVGQFGRALQEFSKTRAGAAFDLVILDDGFQHWKIKKDVEVLALTSARMSDRAFRDWPNQVKQADLVVWTKGDEEPDVFGKPLVKVRFQHKVSSAKPVWIICGVGDPNSVAQSAREAGMDVRREISLEDHAHYDRKLVDVWLRDAAKEGCKAAVTGKDWVKWRQLGISSSDFLVLEPELSFESGQGEWERVLWG